MRPADSAHAAAPLRLPNDAGGPSPSRAAIAIAFVAIALLAALTLANPSTTRMHTWPWALVTAGLCLVPIAWAARMFFSDTSFRPPAGKARLAAGGLLLLAVASVGSAWASPFSDAALARVWPTLGGVALFFILHNRLNEPTAAPGKSSQPIARTLALFGTIVVIVSLAGWVNALPYAPWVNRNTWPFGHSNYTGGFVVLILPWIALQVWRARGIARIAWSVTIVAALLALAGSSSRGAVGALVVVAGCLALATLFFASWTRRQKLFLTLALVVFGAIVVLANPRLRDLVLRRQWSDLAVESNRQRSAMLTAGVRLGLERPLLGWGPASVPLAYPRVRATLDGGVDNVLQLHSTPMQLWATLGLAGAVAGVLIVAGAVGASLPVLKARPRSPHTIAAVCSLGGYGVFSLTDHQLDVPVFAALGAVNLAMITAAARGSQSLQPSFALRALLLGFGAALLAGPAIALGRDLLARRAYEQALVAWEESRPDEFIRALDRAAQFTPHEPFFQHHGAAALLQASEQTIDSARRVALRREARARLEISLRTGAHEEFAHFNLAWLHLELGAPLEAAYHFRAAAGLVPDKGGVYFGLGLALQQAGQAEAAVRAFALEWLNDPRSALSPAWEVPALAELQPAVKRETLHLCSKLKATHPPAAIVERWIRWWFGEPISAAELAPGFTHASAEFAAALPAIRARSPVASAAAWAQLYQAWRGETAAAAFLPVARGDKSFAAALARRAQRHRDDFRAFLAAGTEDEPALLRTLRRQRIGYGVLALHPGGPPLTDLYVVQENRVTADFAAALFPAKGWLPGRFLLALLPAEPR